ncbi:MAG: hypothetical protein WCV79_00545 [Candidatus Paceibacterota bacterium]
MPTKTQSKKINTTRQTKPSSEKEEEEIVITKKSSTKPIEIEETDIIIAEVEKPVDDVVTEDGEVEEVEEAGLNEEDLDPFGDKWEQ